MRPVGPPSSDASVSGFAANTSELQTPDIETLDTGPGTASVPRGLGAAPTDHDGVLALGLSLCRNQYG